MRLGLAIFAVLGVWLLARTPAAAAEHLIRPVGNQTRSVAAPAASPAPAASAAPLHRRKLPHHRLGSRLLRRGMVGTDVRALQFFLGKLQLSSAVADGVFGPGTRLAVVIFQHSRQMRADGIVTRKLARRIRAAAMHHTASLFVFPVAGPHSFGGPESAFGAPRGNHIHEGQDILAACGTPIRAAQGGVVRLNDYQASAAGYYLVTHGAVNGEDYVYAHMIAPSPALAGTPLAPGQQIGAVGQTGDATACHLHFEIWTVPGWYLGGQPYDPLPSLLAWDHP